MSKIAIFPGTFDPITLGHQDLIARIAKLFDTVIVAVGVNTNKATLFDLTQRVQMATQILQQYKNVKVEGFSNLLIEFAREKGATIIIRGVRAASDFEYELQLSTMNRCLDNHIETLLLPPSSQYAFLSSTLVKEVARFGGDLSQFVAPIIIESFKSCKWH